MSRVTTGESVLSRAVRIFDAFSASRHALTVTEISRVTGLHVATASRLIGELVGLGFLTRVEDGRVGIGVRMWELAQRASPFLPLREVAMPYLEDVHDVVGHHVQLGVLDGTDALFLERLSAPGAVVNLTQIAGRLPAHASASGLVLLASSMPEVQTAILSQPLRRFTPRTLTDPERLRTVLARIRRDGYAVTHGHIHLDAAGVAVPIRRDGVVLAAIAAVVPNDDRAHTVVPALSTAARSISRQLSHHRRSETARNVLNH